MSIGRFRWKNSKKTVEGTVAGLITTFVLVCLLAYFQEIQLSIVQYVGIFVVSALAMAMDAYSRNGSAATPSLPHTRPR